jgi:hypothetical protein
MRGVVEALRLAQRHVIAENPVEITIHRTEKIEKDGAFEEIENIVGPITVRVYQRSSGVAPQEISALAGTKYVDARWGLVADHKADIQAGANVKDEFEAFGLRFQVVAVYPQRAFGQVIGFQADLERVS